MENKIILEFPDNKKKDFKKGVTGLEVAKSIGPRLAKDALAVELNGKTIELNEPLEENGKFRVLTWNDLEGKKALWHTASHVLNEAVQELFPNALPTIGPPTDEGFYYDFDVQKTFSQEDLEKIEKKMLEIIQQNKKIAKKMVSKQEALKIFEKNTYKKELINEFAGEGKTLTIYFTGKFADLCKGGHVEDTGKIKALKLLKTSGAYWRGSEKNKMLQRIYGTAFPQQKMLLEYLETKTRAEQNSHLKLGRELDIFSMQREAPGSALFHPNGAMIYNELVNFMRLEQQKRGYEEIIAPIILKKELWEKSGHWDHYKENMYFTEKEKEEFAVKPMNCPGHILYYNSKRHSYRELPLRVAEFGTIHRYELSGVLNGLFRVRKFTQDDAHIFCSKEQLQNEIINVIELIDFVYSVFGFKYSVELSTRPEKFIGTKQAWDNATTALKNALSQKKVQYKINEGDGAFYGPKIDFHIQDSLNRSWQLGTIQVDFSMPQKFESYFINSDDKKETPVMVHRAVLGSLERFIGILIEHFGGNFPLWIAPVQIIVFPVSEKAEDYAKKVHQTLNQNGFKSRLDLRKETVSYKVRDAELQKIPYTITVGEKEKQNNSLAVRNAEGKVEFNVQQTAFLEKLKKEIQTKKTD